MTDSFKYMVQVDIHPQKGGPYKDWLFKKHIADVLSFPGILSAEAVELGKSEDHWDSFMILYIMESVETLTAYQASDLFASFARDWKKYEGLFRLKRFYGPVIEKYT